MLKAAEGTRTHAYIVLSLLTGARIEELRALTWDHVDLEGDSEANPPVPPHVAVWRSVRSGGGTKTRRSRRTLALPKRCVDVLRRHREEQRKAQGDEWAETSLVFASAAGTPLDAANVRHAFRAVLKNAGGGGCLAVDAPGVAAQLRLAADSGVALEEISGLWGIAVRPSRRSSIASRSGRCCRRGPW
ncbi:tyrosine-type recombinase/integrase [Microbispora sp. H11081]|uniref:tyrosine-type recombinase/integrase n=1 Tax=Microbispora sp. H11081 TaxID=2729107 RepID=UPI00289D3612|nr:tyrosine-type recombinase/integrase [Microbispora sp. H11081]